MTINNGPCITLSLTPPIPQLPTPLDFSILISLSFPPAALLALINNGIPCCKFNFTPFIFAPPLGPIALTPYIITINTIIKIVYIAAMAEATAAGIPSNFSIPSCPW